MELSDLKVGDKFRFTQNALVPLKLRTPDFPDWLSGDLQLGSFVLTNREYTIQAADDAKLSLVLHIEDYEVELIN